MPGAATTAATSLNCSPWMRYTQDESSFGRQGNACHRAVLAHVMTNQYEDAHPARTDRTGGFFGDPGEAAILVAILWYVQSHGVTCR